MSSSSQPRKNKDEGSLRAVSEQLSKYGTSNSLVPPNIPPRAGGSETATPARRLSPRLSYSQLQQANSFSLGSSPNTSSPSAFDSYVQQSGSNNEELTDTQKARIVGRHLVNRQEQARSRKASQNRENGKSSDNLKGKLKAAVRAGNQVEDEVLDDDDEEDEVEEEGDSEEAWNSHARLTTDEFPMPFAMQGGDVTHDLYKWQRNTIANSPQNPKNMKRSKSTGELSAASGIYIREGENGMKDEDPLMNDVKKMREPGGFRRNYINRKISEAGSNETTTQSGHVIKSKKATGSFVEFLSLYGHLAGESLEELDEEYEDELDEEAALEAEIREIPEGTPASRNVDERTSLLKRTDTPARIARKRVSMKGKEGQATVFQAVLMLLKSFVGTGILFLGRAFFNGGMLFSIIVLLSIAMISLYSFLLLVKTRLVVPGSFGDMGGVLYGTWLQIAILTSVTLSQVGFVAAYTIFVAENLQAFVLAVSNCKMYIPIAVLIFGQIIFYLPLAMFRDIHKLSGTALVADAFILIGIVYIVYLEVGHLHSFGLGDIVLFNKHSFPLLVGTAVFSFEGVGLVIPITEAMKEPEKFPRVLSGVMVFVALLFGGAGALGYATFGKDIQTVVLVNLPQDDRMVNVVQFLYSIAIMLSTPLQLFPAVRIMEQGIFTKSGKYSNRVKWQKNIFRSLTVLGCTIISWAGARDLDKFVSLIGSVACVPLCFCYPAMLHYKACAQTRWQRIIDISLVFFGVIMAVYTTFQTVSMLAKEQPSSVSNFGKCPAPAN